MAKINSVVRYHYNGQYYDSKKKAIEANEELIHEKVKDMINAVRAKRHTSTLHMQDSIAIAEFLIDHRAVLTDLLDLDFEGFDDE